MSLTPNAINRMFAMSGSSEDPSFLPAVQVLHLKKIDQKGGADDRWKVSGYFMLSLFHVEMSYHAKVSASNAFLFSLSLSLSLYYIIWCRWSYPMELISSPACVPPNSIPK